jgi:hypothetical protein
MSRGSVRIVALVAGAVAWLAGTKRTIATFWGVQVVTLLVESPLVGLPRHQPTFAGGTALMVARDVRPVAGDFGCLGFLFADLGHLIAFLLGWLSNHGTFRRTR